jgi:AraC family transcriptional regulator
MDALLAWPVTERAPSKPRGMSARARTRVVDYIEDHLGDDHELATLARVACLSRFHFARMFRRSMGASPMAYVLRRRIERAKSLLLSGDSSVAGIAFDLGFCDQSHFCRSFRKVTGMTPMGYLISHQPVANRKDSYRESAPARRSNDRDFDSRRDPFRVRSDNRERT